ncbi:MAG: EAL domain-containing protein [Acidimicrobiales bacterium]|nr:EAL domain-containing protein [Acidimicrobiales bacterium]
MLGTPDFFADSPVAYSEFLLATGELTAANKLYCQQRGYSLEELKAASFETRLPGASAEAVLTQVIRLLENKKAKPVDVDVIRADGTLQSLHMNFSLRFDSSGEPVSVLVASVDNNESKAAFNRFEQLIEASPAGQIEVEFDGNIRRTNRAAARIIGYEQAEMIGLFAGDLLVEDDREEVMNAFFDCYAHPGKVVTFETRRVGPDGAELWIQLSITVITDRDAQPESIIVSLVDIDDEVRARHRLAYEASHDPLTNLANRSRLLEVIESAAPNTPAAMLFLDVDRFKRINDRLGHDAGDDLLVAMSRRIEGALRPSDFVARIGGDEFVIWCSDVQEEAHVIDLAQRVVDVIEREPFIVGEDTVSITVSVGASFTEDAREHTALLREADMAMYRAKAQGRARIEIFNHAVRSNTRALRELAEELADGIDRGEIILHYQPIVELATGRIAAAEGLARWRHPAQGLLSPGRFIELAEETGLIVPLGKRVLDQAISDLASLEAYEDFRLAINLSPRQMANRDIATVVEKALAEHLVEPERFNIEITESMLMEDANGSVTMLQALRDLGVHLAIDDFGTGYSSLAYLRWFPVQKLKIDQSFVQAIEEDDADLLIVQSIIGLAHGLGMETVAEGIETPRQLQILRDIGCTYGQGYHLARPMPYADLVELMSCPNGLAHAAPPSTAESTDPVALPTTW